MKDAQLEKMSLADLRDLRQRIDDTIASKQKRERVELKERVQSMVREAGFDLSELFGAGGRKAARGKASGSAKYQHPDNPELTWSGRGRKPKWLSGASDPESFRVR